MTSGLKEYWQPPAIAPLNPALAADMRRRIDGKAVLLVFATDHGLTEEGVSQYPSAVTVAMVMTYLAGRASANAFAAASNATICVVDAGVAADLPAHPDLIAAKVTRFLLEQD